MKAILVMGLFVISTSAFSAVFKSYDAKHSCDLYRAGTSEETEPRDGEEVVTTKSVYGFSFSDLEIDFKKREASVQIIKNVALGLNGSLLSSRATIAANHPDFTSLINKVNRKIYLLEKICIGSGDKIVYANEREEQK
jgi:hypothetical protein